VLPLYLNMAARNSGSTTRNGEGHPNPINLRLAAAHALRRASLPLASAASDRIHDKSHHHEPMTRETLISLLDEALAIGNDMDEDGWVTDSTSTSGH